MPKGEIITWLRRKYGDGVYKLCVTKNPSLFPVGGETIDRGENMIVTIVYLEELENLDEDDDIKRYQVYVI